MDEKQVGTEKKVPPATKLGKFFPAIENQR
jgi:hypothetical protein